MLDIFPVSALYVYASMAGVFFILLLLRLLTVHFKNISILLDVGLIFLLLSFLVLVILQGLSFVLLATAILNYGVFIATLVVSGILSIVIFRQFKLYKQAYQPVLGQDFVGCIASIMHEQARVGKNVKACLKDAQGKVLFINVEAEYGEIMPFSQVLVVKAKRLNYVVRMIEPLAKQTDE